MMVAPAVMAAVAPAIMAAMGAHDSPPDDGALAHRLGGGRPHHGALAHRLGIGRRRREARREKGGRRGGKGHQLHYAILHLVGFPCEMLNVAQAQWVQAARQGVAGAALSRAKCRCTAREKAPMSKCCGSSWPSRKRASRTAWKAGMSQRPRRTLAAT